jgi:hypothetical protein
LDTAQAHIEAKLKQFVLRVFRQMIGERDNARVFMLGERLERRVARYQICLTP